MYSNGNQQTLPRLVMFALQVGNKYHFKWQHFNRQHSQELEAHYNKCVITRANSEKRFIAKQKLMMFPVENTLIFLTRACIWFLRKRLYHIVTVQQAT